MPTITYKLTERSDSFFVTDEIAQGANVYAFEGDDTVSGIDTYGDLILGNQGDDILFGYNGQSSGRIGPGDDTMIGGFGNDTLYGGGGNDLLVGSEDSDLVYGDTGNDDISGNEGSDILYGGAGNDLLRGNQSEDVCVGNEGNDTIFGGFGNDIVFANQDADLLYGNEGADTIYGGFGDDTIIGGPGADRLYGNEGADRFVFGPEDLIGRPTDVIMEFRAGDVIELRGGITYAQYAEDDFTFVVSLLDPATGNRGFISLYQPQGGSIVQT